MASLTINECKVTCEAAPFQVEGTVTVDGASRPIWFYLRYRFCKIWVGFGDALDTAVEQTTTYQDGPLLVRHYGDSPECPGDGFCSDILQRQEVEKLLIEAWQADEDW